MRLTLRSAALILAFALTPLLPAQSPAVGGPLPLTDTRYGGFGGVPLLRTDGTEMFLFWTSGSKLRVTRLADGLKRAGRPVMDVDFGYDAVWTGSHFLVVGHRVVANTHTILGRLVSATGESIGSEFPIADRYGMPRLAYSGGKVLLTLGGDAATNTMLLERDGRRAADPRDLNLLSEGSWDFAATTRGSGFAVAAALGNRVKIFALQADGDLQDAPEVSISPEGPRKLAAASHGEDVLVAWTNGAAPIETVSLGTNAALGTRSVIPGTEGATALDLHWTGTEWALAFVAAKKTSTILIDPVSRALAHFPAAAAHDLSPVRLGSLEGRTTMTWRGTAAGAPLLLSEIRTPSSSAGAAFAAAEQEFQTATSSLDATLVVWSEFRDGHRTLHAGARNGSGSWHERRIGGDEEVPVAASDGSGFLVARRSGSNWTAVALDRDLQITAASPPIPSFVPADIVWNGREYVAIGITPGGSVVASKISTTAVVTPPVLIAERQGQRELSEARIAAGGGGFLAVWQDSETNFCFPVCDMYDSLVRGTRLNAELQRIDPADLEIAPDESEYPRVLWDGRRFVVFFTHVGISMRTIQPNGAASDITSLLGYHDWPGRLSSTLLADGTIALTYGQGLGIFVRDGAVAGESVLGRPDSADRLVRLGPGAIYGQTSVEEALPYHGATRVLTRVLSPVLGELPQAPQLRRASLAGGNIELEWTRPQGAVNGYRLEYRVNDGVWNELDRWFDVEETSISIRPWAPGARYQFRVRAWSDAGLSGYSGAETVRAPRKRRAMR